MFYSRASFHYVHTVQARYPILPAFVFCIHYNLSFLSIVAIASGIWNRKEGVYHVPAHT